jgi:zinc-binding alcohol dehydrogenase family protein
MKAVGLYRHLPIDHPEAFIDAQIEMPVAAGHDLLVEVKAASVNPVDYKVRSSGEPEKALRVLGWDAAGIVRAVGPAVTLFKPGNDVYYAGSITRAGSNSEYQLVDERIVGAKPTSLGFAQAAALPLTTLTAWEGLFDRLGISATGADKGKVLLVIGGAGGVGSIAIQLSKQIAQLKVIATASRPESSRWVTGLGADHVINHHEDLSAQLTALGIPEVDCILCANDIDAYFPKFAALIKPQGRICLIVSTRNPVNLTSLMQKSVTVAWELMFTRSMFGTPDMIRQHEILTEAAQLLDQGTLRTTLGKHLGGINAANLKHAHQLLEAGRTIGKLVLEGFD